MDRHLAIEGPAQAGPLGEDRVSRVPRAEGRAHKFLALPKAYVPGGRQKPHSSVTGLAVSSDSFPVFALGGRHGA